MPKASPHITPHTLHLLPCLVYTLLGMCLHNSYTTKLSHIHFKGSGKSLLRIIKAPQTATIIWVIAICTHISFIQWHHNAQHTSLHASLTHWVTVAINMLFPLSIGGNPFKCCFPLTSRCLITSAYDWKTVKIRKRCVH